MNKETRHTGIKLESNCIKCGKLIKGEKKKNMCRTCGHKKLKKKARDLLNSEKDAEDNTNENHSQQPGELANIQGEGGCTESGKRIFGFGSSGVDSKKPSADTLCKCGHEKKDHDRYGCCIKDEKNEWCSCEEKFAKRGKKE